MSAPKASAPAFRYLFFSILLLTVTACSICNGFAADNPPSQGLHQPSLIIQSNNNQAAEEKEKNISWTNKYGPFCLIMAIILSGILAALHKGNSTKVQNAGAVNSGGGLFAVKETTIIGHLKAGSLDRYLTGLQYVASLEFGSELIAKELCNALCKQGVYAKHNHLDLKVRSRTAVFVILCLERLRCAQGGLQSPKSSFDHMYYNVSLTNLLQERPRWLPAFIYGILEHLKVALGGK